MDFTFIWCGKGLFMLRHLRKVQALEFPVIAPIYFVKCTFSGRNCLSVTMTNIIWFTRIPKFCCQFCFSNLIITLFLSFSYITVLNEQWEASSKLSRCNQCWRFPFVGTDYLWYNWLLDHRCCHCRYYHIC